MVFRVFKNLVHPSFHPHLSLLTLALGLQLCEVLQQTSLLSQLYGFVLMDNTRMNQNAFHCFLLKPVYGLKNLLRKD